MGEAWLTAPPAVAYTVSESHCSTEVLMSNTELARLTVTHATVRRLVRADQTVVLEITAIHPLLALSESCADSPLTSAVERFNQAYLAMAEAFCAHCAEVISPRAVDAFRSAGHGAACTFDRHTATCRMEAETSEEGLLTVRRTVAVGSRRGSIPSLAHESLDRWRASDLSLLGGREGRGNTR